MCFLLLENSVGYHDIGRIASGEPHNLAEIGEFAGKSKLLLRLHAAFMLAAWIGTASIGILLARYNLNFFKKILQNSFINKFILFV